MMMINGDDRGFVNNVSDIIDNLTWSDDVSGNVGLTLANNDYISALLELKDKNYIYEFSDKYDNKIYLIRHWFIHNVYRNGLNTNYFKYLSLVELENGEYHLKETHIKESKIKENKVNKVNKDTDKTDEEWKEMLEELNERPQ